MQNHANKTTAQRSTTLRNSDPENNRVKAVNEKDVAQAFQVFTFVSWVSHHLSQSSARKINFRGEVVQLPKVSSFDIFVF